MNGLRFKFSLDFGDFRLLFHIIITCTVTVENLIHWRTSSFQFICITHMKLVHFSKISYFTNQTLRHQKKLLFVPWRHLRRLTIEGDDALKITWDLSSFRKGSQWDLLRAFTFLPLRQKKKNKKDNTFPLEWEKVKSHYWI